MITIHNLLKFARHISGKDRAYRDQRIMHPERDWFIGLFSVTLLFLAGGLGVWYLFDKRGGALVEDHGVTIDTVKYDAKLITRVLTDYARRQEHYESLRGDVVSVPNATTTEGTTSTSTPTETVPQKKLPVAKEVPLQVE